MPPSQKEPYGREIQSVFVYDITYRNEAGFYGKRQKKPDDPERNKTVLLVRQNSEQ